MRAPLPALLILLAGCSATRHLGPPPVEVPPRRPPPLTVVIEPFFEQARLVTVERTQTAVVSPYGAGGRLEQVTVVERGENKPLLAQVPTLAALHLKVLHEVRRRRPGWRVLSTGELPTAQGEVTLVRTVVGDSELLGSNRTLRTVAFGFGLVLLPLLAVAAGPIEETQRVYGLLARFDAPAGELAPRLLRYPTQPDFAVDTRGLQAKEQPFGLDIAYEEGLFTDPDSKHPILIEAFAQQLAGAIVAVVEGY